jgi:hypothetical protein
MLTLIREGRYASVRDFGRAVGQGFATMVALVTMLFYMMVFGGLS